MLQFCYQKLCKSKIPRLGSNGSKVMRELVSKTVDSDSTSRVEYENSFSDICVPEKCTLQPVRAPNTWHRSFRMKYVCRRTLYIYVHTKARIHACTHADTTIILSIDNNLALIMRSSIKKEWHGPRKSFLWECTRRILWHTYEYVVDFDLWKKIYTNSLENVTPTLSKSNSREFS